MPARASLRGSTIPNKPPLAKRSGRPSYGSNAQARPRYCCPWIGRWKRPCPGGSRSPGWAAGIHGRPGQFTLDPWGPCRLGLRPAASVCIGNPMACLRRDSCRPRPRRRLNPASQSFVVSASDADQSRWTTCAESRIHRRRHYLPHGGGGGQARNSAEKSFRSAARISSTCESTSSPRSVRSAARYSRATVTLLRPAGTGLPR